MLKPTLFQMSCGSMQLASGRSPYVLLFDQTKFLSSLVLLGSLARAASIDRARSIGTGLGQCCQSPHSPLEASLLCILGPCVAAINTALFKTCLPRDIVCIGVGALLMVNAFAFSAPVSVHMISPCTPYQKDERTPHDRDSDPGPVDRVGKMIPSWNATWLLLTVNTFLSAF